jgi:sigma-B regulation protein RsbU (phosphoserine phosphatase)
MNGTQYIAISRVMNNGWFLSVQIPSDEIFAEVEMKNRRFSLIIAFSSILMLCGAFYLISKLLNTPLKKLTDEVSRLGLGNLDIHIDVATNDELGLLARTFNKMTADLKASIEAYAHEHSEKERLGTELDIATKIQSGMLPCIFPAFPHRREFDIYASMQPAKEVGGDFYDFFLIDEDKLAVVMADVSGKGVPAALFMVIAKTLIKNNAQYGLSPKEVFETVNNLLCENNEAQMFVTATLGYLDIPSGKFTFVNAAHNPPLIKRAGLLFDWLKAKSGFVLAGMEDMFYTEHEITLHPGDELFLYTDGITEAMNRESKLFGDPRLIETVNNHSGLPLKEFSEKIKDDIDRFAGGAEQADDITMLALRYKGTPVHELFVEAKPENMDSVLDFVNGQIGGCPVKIQNQIGIAVDEVFSNIARYAYNPETGSVAVRIAVDDAITIEFEDKGVPYNPIETAAPDTSLSAEEREPGGLGIFMVKKLMDTVEYRREGNKNILTIKKTGVI